MMAFVFNEAPFIPKDEIESIKRSALLLTLQSHDYNSKRSFVNSLCVRTRWLVKTAKRTLARKQRLKNKILDEATLDCVVDEQNLGDRLDHSEICSFLVGSLTELERRLIELKVYENRTYREIIAETGLSIYKARRHYNDAIKKMKMVADAHYRNYEF